MPKKQKLPAGVVRRTRADGSHVYLGWVASGRAGEKEWTHTCRDPLDAARMRQELLDLRKDVPRAVVTFLDAVNLVRERLKRECRPGTCRWFEQQAAPLLSFFREQTHVNTIRTADVQRFVDERSKEVASATVGHHRRGLRLIFGAVDGQILRSPLVGVQWPKVERPRREAFTVAEIRDLLRRIRESGRECAERDHDVIAALFATGWRRGELARMRVEDINFATARAWVEGKTEHEYSDLGPEALAILRRMVERVKTGPLIPGGYTRVSLTFLRWRRILGESRLRPHACRRSFISCLIDGGNSVETVQRLARHERIEQTMSYYSGSPQTRKALDGLRFTSETTAETLQHVVGERK